ncbi:MAG: hypothetical protein KGP28_08905 [Bdellovibrionales bacterium]|nr:hypothetical protein [Bdellovibrionales bacterium]
MILKNYWAHSGYDAEEAYFAKINRELIDRIKAQQQGKELKKATEDTPLAEIIPFPSREQRMEQKKKAA